MADPTTTPFIMHGARDAMAGGVMHIERQIVAIERAVVEEPGLAFDLAKTIVESTCRAVLNERSIPFAEDDDLPQLFRSVRQTLPFLPTTASGAAEVRTSLDKTLAGLHTAVQGICELRNKCGFASHGSGGPRPVMESVQALLAAEAADAIVGFLHRVHRQDRSPLTASGPTFDDNHSFNDHVDSNWGSFIIFESEFRASEVLYQMEPETYRIKLTEFDDGNTQAETQEVEEVQP
jgi:hypothetical protein